MKKINIAIDGPAGSGKGTVAKIVAKKLNYKYIDTGVMYRLLTYLIIKDKINIDDDEKIKEHLIDKFDYEVKDDKVYFDNKDVTLDLRSKEVNALISPVARKPYVRKFMVELQQNIASEKGVVMDGRDITSVVMPDAELKIYLDASLDERARRRYIDEVNKGGNMTFEEVKKSVANRDYNDLEVNKTLVKCVDSVVIDSTNTTVDEVVNKVLSLVKERVSNDWGSSGIYR